MDARDRLRLYLEQRRELGESEFVLDSLPLEEALRLIGHKGAPSAGTPTPAGAEATRPRSPRDEPATGGNWKDALKAIGAEETAPAAKTKKPAASARAAAPATSVAEPTPAEPTPAEPTPTEPTPTEPTPTVGSPAEPGTGIVVGASRRASMDGPLAALASLDDVARHIAACTACELYKSAKNSVPGEGNPQAGFICVGEAPGQTEDETGRPFVGRAGDLLTKILEAVQLKREDVFICNVLKHRPPGNRNPAPDEIKACSPYLLRQLELLQPRVILALGTFASQTLLQTALPIGKLRGQVHRFHGVPLIVTYHPAALLRNPAWKRPAWEDVQLARRIYDSAVQG